MSYVGNTNTTQGFIPAIDYFSGNGSTVAFTLSRPVASVAQVQANISNVPQNPSSAFSVSGNTITFTSAPPSGTNNIYVYYTSPITQVIAPSQGTVTSESFGTIVNFTTTGNTVLGDASTDTLNVGNGGLVKDASGNVGIGTSSPAFGGFGSNTGGIQITNANNAALKLNGNAGGDFYFVSGTAQNWIYGTGAIPMSFATNGSERMRIDSSGNVGIGTSTTSGSVLNIANSSSADELTFRGTPYTVITSESTGGMDIKVSQAVPMCFYTSNAERMRIDASGNLLVGTTATGGNNVGFRVYGPYGTINSATATADYSIFNKTTTTTGKQIEFRSADTNVGNITSTSTATQFNTSSSDYRLKDEVSEFTGGLGRIKALRPVSFRWKAQDVHDIGFIAHEMQAIVPECVTGEKDAVDSDGNPEYQSIFPAPAQMIATLVSAIQEQQAIIQTLTDRITALEGAK